MIERRCNECTLCCRLLPVAEINKPAGSPCTHQRSKGCRIYQKAGYPTGCRLWSCLWLGDESLPLQRPDRVHYVIDTTPEFVVIDGQAVSVVQIWIDPRFPDAHRDPSLRAWLASRWDTQQQLGLVRFDSVVSEVLFPPSATDYGVWIEATGRQCAEHSTEEIVETMRRLKTRHS